MGAIDWNLLTPRNADAPSREVASITSLLSAFADRRDKMAAEQAARQQAEAHFQTQMQEKYADNARDEQLRKEQYQVTRDQMAAAQQQREYAQNQAVEKERRDAREKAFGALQANNPDEARFIVENHGGQFAPAQAQHLDAPKEQQTAAPDMLGMLQPFYSAADAGQNFQAKQQVDTENARRDKSVAGTYGVQFPSLPGMEPANTTTFMSALADNNARINRGKQAAGWLDEMAPSYADTPAKQQAVREARAGLVSGALPPDKDAVWKAVTGRASELEGNAEAEKRARIGAANKGQVTPTQHVDDVRADVTQFRQDYSSWEKNNNVDKLTDTYDQFTNMKNAVANAKDTGDVIGQRAALYQAARLITGPGVLTAQEFNNTVQGTSGVLASAISKVRKQLDGEISDQEAAALEKFVMNQNGNVKAAALRKLRNFDRHYGTGSYFTKTVPDQVKAERQSFMDRFGITEDDTKPPKSSGPTTDEDARMRRAGF